MGKIKKAGRTLGSKGQINKDTAVFATHGLFKKSDNKKTDKNKEKFGNDRLKSSLHGVKKKMKRKLRREKLLSKLSDAQSVKEKLKKTKQRQKTVIVGDIQPLIDALPDSGSLIDHSEKNKKQSKREQNDGNIGKGTNRKSWKTRRKAELADIHQFQQILGLSRYKSDPVGAISDHVKYITQETST